jgi:hypothetical protein
VNVKLSCGLVVLIGVFVDYPHTQQKLHIICDMDTNNRLPSINAHCEDKHINLSTKINRCNVSFIFPCTFVLTAIT